MPNNPTQAARWQSLAASMVPPGTPLHNAPRARRLLNDAAVWQGETGYRGWIFRFEDGSKLVCHEHGTMAL